MNLTSQQTKLLQIALGVLVIVALYYYFGHEEAPTPTPAPAKSTEGLYMEHLEDVEGNTLPEEEANIEQSLAPQPPVELPAEDETSLLPKYDESDQFAKDHPVTALLKEQNYLIGGHHNGIISTLQSNKIPYLDIRELPPIIKEDVGPWNNSSYEQAPGATRRGFVLN